VRVCVGVKNDKYSQTLSLCVCVCERERERESIGDEV
jgi:hypothetical protein